MQASIIESGAAKPNKSQEVHRRKSFSPCFRYCVSLTSIEISVVGEFRECRSRSLAGGTELEACIFLLYFQGANNRHGKHTNQQPNISSSSTHPSETTKKSITHTSNIHHHKGYFTDRQTDRQTTTDVWTHMLRHEQPAPSRVPPGHIDTLVSSAFEVPHTSTHQHFSFFFALRSFSSSSFPSFSNSRWIRFTSILVD